MSTGELSVRSPILRQALQEEKGRRMSNLRGEVKPWIEDVLGITFPQDSDAPTGSGFLQDLRNGVVICQLINKLRPKTFETVWDETSDKSENMRATENILQFQQACKAMGLEQKDIFQVTDLTLAKNPVKVFECLAAVRRKLDSGVSIGRVASSASGSSMYAATAEIRSPLPPSRTRSAVLQASAKKQPPARMAGGQETSTSASGRPDRAGQILADLRALLPSKDKVAMEEDSTGTIVGGVSNGAGGMAFGSPLRRGRLGAGDEGGSARPGRRYKTVTGLGGLNGVAEGGIDNTGEDASHFMRRLHQMALRVREVEAENKKLRDDQTNEGSRLFPLVQQTSLAFRELSSSVRAEVADMEECMRMYAAQVQSASAQMNAKYLKERRTRRAAHEKLIDLQGNIRVFARARPLSNGEKDAGESNCVRFIDENTMAVVDLEEGKAGRDIEFEFDRVFPPRSTQEEVFDEVSPLVQSAIDGYNVCIFAYGQTGSGKTHTMEGSPSARGVNYRALEQLFDALRECVNEIKSEVSMSVVEVYNEQVRDLLLDRQAYKRSAEGSGLELRQNAKGEVYVQSLTELKVASVSDVTELMRSRAFPNRQTSATQMNAHSSRSHSLLFVNITTTNVNTGDSTFGRLVMIDLAGSERVKKSGASGQAMIEAQNINKSLSALGDVIAALKTKEKHVPYRNSKLTYLLQDCLGGNSKCMMFCNVSPSDSNFSETSCSLKFAQRVRNTQLGTAKRQLAKGSSLSNPTCSGTGGPGGIAAAALPKLPPADAAALAKARDDAQSLREEVAQLKKELCDAEEHKRQQSETVKTLRDRNRQLERDIDLTKHEVAQLSYKVKRSEERKANAGGFGGMGAGSRGSRSSISMPAPVEAVEPIAPSLLSSVVVQPVLAAPRPPLPPPASVVAAPSPVPCLPAAAALVVAPSPAPAAQRTGPVATPASSSSSYALQASQALQRAVALQRQCHVPVASIPAAAMKPSTVCSMTDDADDEWTAANAAASGSLPAFTALNAEAAAGSTSSRPSLAATGGRPSLAMAALTSSLGALDFNAALSSQTSTRASFIAPSTSSASVVSATAAPLAAAAISSSSSSGMVVTFTLPSGIEPSPPRKRKSHDDDEPAPAVPMRSVAFVEEPVTICRAAAVAAARAAPFAVVSDSVRVNGCLSVTAISHPLLPKTAPTGHSTLGRKGAVTVQRVSDVAGHETDDDVENVQPAATANVSGKPRKRACFGDVVTKTLASPDISLCDDSLLGAQQSVQPAPVNVQAQQSSAFGGSRATFVPSTLGTRFSGSVLARSATASSAMAFSGSARLGGATIAAPSMLAKKSLGPPLRRPATARPIASKVGSK